MKLLALIVNNNHLVGLFYVGIYVGKINLIYLLPRLILPLVIREISSALLHTFTSLNSTNIADLSTFGFLYGTFPAAPGVFVYATTYSLDTDLVSNIL